MVLRPDELASQAQIERNRQGDENLKNIFKKGAKTALNVGSTAAGVGLSSKILPFLSEYITPDLAIKGISKISPQIGNFLKAGMKNGLDVQSGLDYIKKNITQEQEQQQKPEKRNVIQKYSDKLHEYLSQKISQGYNPIQAGAVAFDSPEFKPIIQKLVKDNKASWADILEAIYGTQQQAQPQTQQNQGQQKLMAMLQQLQQMRKGQ